MRNFSTINRTIIILVIFCFCQRANTQNLVPNPSFEDILQCPYGPSGTPSEIPYAVGWAKPPGSVTTPDLFHYCALDTGQLCPSTLPVSFAGYCIPRTGDAVAGLLCYFGYGCADSREYIQVGLKEPLEANGCYYVEYWVLLGSYSSYSVNHIGLEFSVDSLEHGTCNNLSLNSETDISYDNQITDTLNWTKISGYYHADGGERFITIGNFIIDDETNIQDRIGNNIFCELAYGGAYYFIDDVSVIEDTIVNCVNEVVMPNIITPNSDGFNDLFVPTSYLGITSSNITICDRWGQTVYYSEDLLKGWDGINFNGDKCINGVYFWIVNYIDLKFQKHSIQGTVTLID